MATETWGCIAYLLLLSWGVSTARRVITDKGQVVVDEPENLGLGGQVGGWLGGQVGGGLGGQVGGGLGGGIFGGGIHFSPGFGIGGIVGGGIGNQGGGSDEGEGHGGGQGGGNCGGGNCGRGCGCMGFGDGEGAGPAGFVTPGYGTPGFEFGGSISGRIGSGLYCTPTHCPAATSKGVRLHLDQGESNVHNDHLKVDHAPMEGRNSHGKNGNHAVEDKHEQRKMPADESNTNAEGRQEHTMDAIAPESTV